MVHVPSTNKENIQDLPEYYIAMLLTVCGVRGGVVVKKLRYKPAGRGLDSRCCHWNFSGT